MKKLFFIFHFSFLISAACAADSGQFDMERWYEIHHDVQSRAVSLGISPSVINDVIQPSVFIPSIVKSDRNQAEFTLTLSEYLDRMVNQTRIANGRKMGRTYPTLLRRVNQAYGVPPAVILAFWGLESNYGEYKARYKLSDAFLTLMYDGRRQTFFDRQLFALMKHASDNNLKIGDIRGSWAGAMGHFQFIPTTLADNGADGNGDGRIDIINNISDAMFSAGNYLGKLGWDPAGSIVRRVTLPADFDMSLCDGKTKKTPAEWAAIGVTADATTGMICDESAPDVGYLAYPNFYRVKRWNNSNRYAVAVSALADELK